MTVHVISHSDPIDDGVVAAAAAANLQIALVILRYDPIHDAAAGAAS